MLNRSFSFLFPQNYGFSKDGTFFIFSKGWLCIFLCSLGSVGCLLVSKVWFLKFLCLFTDDPVRYSCTGGNWERKEGRMEGRLKGGCAVGMKNIRKTVSKEKALNSK